MIGKTIQQIDQFSHFLFTHIEELNQLLKQRIKFKIVEKKKEQQIQQQQLRGIIITTISTFHFKKIQQ